VTLNKREQTIAWILLGVGVVAGAYWGGDQYLAQRAGASQVIADLKTQIKLDEKAKNQGASDQEEMLTGRNLQQINFQRPDPAKTDTLIRDLFQRFPQELIISSWNATGLRAVSLGPRDPNREAAKDFQECRYTATGTTTTARLARFLQTIETVAIPARIDSLTITTPNIGVDRLRVEMTISALVFSPKTAPPSTGRASATTPASHSATASRPATQRTNPGGSSGRTPNTPNTSQPGRTRTTNPAISSRPAPSTQELESAAAAMARRRAEEEQRIATMPAPDTRPRDPAEIEREMMLRRARETGESPSTLELPRPSTSPAPATSAASNPLGGNP
jgi:hypothetical protein